MTARTIPLGFAVGSGEEVRVPVLHTVVTGQTQQSGKTTTLEAMVTRSNLSAIAFVTKRHEGSFRTGWPVPPFFRERADWEFVSAVLEATLRERLKFERSWIMRACRGAETLADVHRNVRALMAKARGLSGDVYFTLDQYLEKVVPQIAALPQNPSGIFNLQTGLNVMDLSAFSPELQALVMRSVLDMIYHHRTATLVIIPEAWEFIPQGRGSPVKLAAEQLIRKGGAAGNFVWLDSQDIAGVAKDVLRSAQLWILGVQREANEAKRMLAHIPGGVRKPKLDDVMMLERGQFIVCHGKTVIRTYVQPEWMDAASAREVALGHITVEAASGRKTTMDTAHELRSENERLKSQLAKATRDIETLTAQIRELNRKQPAQPAAPSPTDASRRPEPIVHLTPGENPPTIENIYQEIKTRLLAERAGLLAVLAEKPEIEVIEKRRVVRMSTDKQPGFIAAMIARGFFDRTRSGSEVVDELKRRGRSVHHTNVYRDLNNLALDGFLTREGEGYLAAADMKINIVSEAA
jgi:hypothetical protein